MGQKVYSSLVLIPPEAFCFPVLPLLSQLVLFSRLIQSFHPSFLTSTLRPQSNLKQGKELSSIGRTLAPLLARNRANHAS